MFDTPSALLARDLRWPDRLVPALLGQDGGRAWLVRNRHLSAQVVQELAAGADTDTLLVLLGARRGDLAGLGACLARAEELVRDAPAGDHQRVALDQGIAHALLRADSADRARVAAGNVADPVPGPCTAAVLLALGLRTEAALAAADRTTRVLWLTSPAGAALPDEVAWELLRRRAGDRSGAGHHLLDALGLLLSQRPGLLTRPVPEEDAALRVAWADMAEVLRGRVVAGLTARTPWRRWAARRALLAREARALRSGRYADFAVHPGPATLAYVAGIAGFTDGQRAQLLEVLRRQWTSDLGHLTPVVARRLGGAAELDEHSPLALTWKSLRRHRSGYISAEQEQAAYSAPPVPFPTDGSLRVAELAPGHVAGAAAFLARALADPEAGLEAARWEVVLRLADDFTGSFAEVAQVTTALAPAR